MYIIFEIQKSDTVATLVTTYENRNQAESAFHSVLSASAVSAVPVHSCALMTDEGVVLRSECYRHFAPEPSTETEE